MDDVVISHQPEKSRYQATVGGEVAGFAQYQLTDEIIVFTHTEVDPAYEGRGVGSALAAFALADVEADGRRQVLPICPFIKAWIGRHPDYHHLMYGAPRSRVAD